MAIGWKPGFRGNRWQPLGGARTPFWLTCSPGALIAAPCLKRRAGVSATISTSGLSRTVR